MLEDGRLAKLEALLGAAGPIAVAVSGGVDSMTLATVAHRAAPGRTSMFHAASPAVPPEAGARVRRSAAREGWDLRVVTAGEFADDRYLENPVDRCFFCKSNLYGTLSRLTAATLLSGTNLDDLGDYRPGLKAAEAFGVRHPWVEAGVDKAGVRAIARGLGLDDVAELPAAPCLSSRLETGIRVTAPALAFVHRIERLVAEAIRPRTVRCRIRHAGVAVELDPESLATLTSAPGAGLRAAILQASKAQGYGERVAFEPYRMGSAFKRDLVD